VKDYSFASTSEGARCRPGVSYLEACSRGIHPGFLLRALLQSAPFPAVVSSEGAVPLHETNQAPGSLLRNKLDKPQLSSMAKRRAAPTRATHSLTSGRNSSSRKGHPAAMLDGRPVPGSSCWGQRPGRGSSVHEHVRAGSQPSGSTADQEVFALAVQPGARRRQALESGPRPETGRELGRSGRASFPSPRWQPAVGRAAAGSDVEESRRENRGLAPGALPSSWGEIGGPWSAFSRGAPRFRYRSGGATVHRRGEKRILTRLESARVTPAQARGACGPAPLQGASPRVPTVRLKSYP